MFRSCWTLWILGLCVVLYPLPGHAVNPTTKTSSGPEPTPGPSGSGRGSLFAPTHPYLWAARAVRLETLRYPLMTRSYSKSQPARRFETTSIEPGASFYTLVLRTNPLDALNGFISYMRRIGHYTDTVELYLLQWDDDWARFREIHSVCNNFPPGPRYCIRKRMPLPLHAYPIPKKHLFAPDNFPITENVVAKLLNGPDHLPRPAKRRGAPRLSKDELSHAVAEMLTRFHARCRMVDEWGQDNPTTQAQSCAEDAVQGPSRDEASAPPSRNEASPSPTRDEASTSPTSDGAFQAPSPLSLPSSSTANLHDCEEIVAHVIETDMGWVTDWVHDMAEQAGLVCSEENDDTSPRGHTLDNCIQQVDQVVSESPRWVRSWFEDLFERVGANCDSLDEGAAGIDTSCTQAVEEAVAEENPWIGEMMQLLLQHLDWIECVSEDLNDDSHLLQDVLRFLQNHFNMTLAQLYDILTQSQSWLRLHFPELLDVLAQFTAASLPPESCFQQRPFGKRSSVEQGGRG
ncbi:hypothetical protein CDD81_461 [Ophiocordyceps australis]|uniref:Uncharacterized protein n=1 Tax=Ophiocordyceps australis TaxID=1399860 RepID=A0A2C5XXZ0_9HYPO|nr:hypothetical protein CDD81_461 [Ophiocordyceps australis]